METKTEQVVYRIYGKSDNPQPVYAKAALVCSFLDADMYTIYNKSETI